MLAILIQVGQLLLTQTDYQIKQRSLVFSVALAVVLDALVALAALIVSIVSVALIVSDVVNAAAVVVAADVTVNISRFQTITMIAKVPAVFAGTFL